MTDDQDPTRGLFAAAAAWVRHFYPGRMGYFVSIGLVDPMTARRDKVKLPIPTGIPPEAGVPGACEVKAPTEWEPGPEQVAILVALREASEDPANSTKSLGTKELTDVVFRMSGSDRRSLWKSKGKAGFLDELIDRGYVQKVGGRRIYRLTPKGEDLAERY